MRDQPQNTWDAVLTCSAIAGFGSIVVFGLQDFWSILIGPIAPFFVFMNP